MKPGTRVKMNQRLKDSLRNNGCHDHVQEFGRCVGTVVGRTDFNSVPRGDPAWKERSVGPEVDICWQPSNLTYAYHPDNLEVVPKILKESDGGSEDSPMRGKSSICSSVGPPKLDPPSDPSNFHDQVTKEVRNG